MITQIDVMVLTPMPLELAALRKVLGEPEFEHATNHFSYVIWKSLEFKSKTYGGTLVAVMPIEKDQVPAGNTTHLALDKWQPEVFALMGIAGQLSDKIKLGDVVVGRHLLQWDAKRKEHVDKENVPQTSYSLVPAPTAGWGANLANLFKSNPTLYDEWKALCAKHRTLELNDGLPELHVEDIASGSATIDSEELRDMLANLNRYLYAVETEAVATLTAFHAKSSGHSMVIRGISDPSARKQDSDAVGEGAWRRYAADNAAQLLWILLRSYSTDEFADGGRGKQNASSHRSVTRDSADANKSQHQPLDKQGVETYLKELKRKTNTILRRNRRTKNFKVNRAELSVLIGAARADATDSIVNISGDLSWLESDLHNLEAVRLLKPTLNMTIFFDQSRTRLELFPALRRAEQLGVELRPYPMGFTPELKCIMIDHNSADFRLCTFNRVIAPAARFSSTKSQTFIWREYTKGDMPAMSQSLMGLLTTIRSTPIRVAICGVNNVGKSSLVRCLYAILKNTLKVEVVQDVFREPIAGTSSKDNYVMLWTQRDEEQQQSTATIRIFDRCLVDNLCFTRMREGNEGIYSTLARQIGRYAKTYDLLVDVKFKDNNYDQNTRCVTGSERQLIRRFLDEFFISFLLEPRVVEVDRTDFETSINRAAAELAEEIRGIITQRSVSEEKVGAKM